MKISTPRSPIVCFVGISNKPGLTGRMAALAEKTLSGKIITSVESQLRSTAQGSSFFRDNLVRNPPLEDGKLRYPNQKELISEWRAFERRLSRLKTNVVILLGELVADFFKTKREVRMLQCSFADGLLLKWVGLDGKGNLILAVAHPSYVGIYARKRLHDYIDNISKAVLSLNREPSDSLAK